MVDGHARPVMKELDTRPIVRGAHPSPYQDQVTGTRGEKKIQTVPTKPPSVQETRVVIFKSGELLLLKPDDILSRKSCLHCLSFGVFSCRQKYKIKQAVDATIFRKISLNLNIKPI